MDDIIEGTNAYREYIRSGGVPENNEQWTSHLAKNLAEGTRRTKSPPGTPRSHELEEERARLRATQAMAPPPRIPLDLRLTEEELRLRETRRTLESEELRLEETRRILERLSNVVADIVEDENLNAAVDLINNRLDEDEASEQKDRENQNSSSGKEEASHPNEGQSNPGHAPLPASEQQLIDMAGDENEESLFHPHSQGIRGTLQIGFT